MTRIVKSKAYFSAQPLHSVKKAFLVLLLAWLLIVALV